MSTHPVAVQRRQQRRRNALLVSLAVLLTLLVLFFWALANLTSAGGEGPSSVASSRADQLAFTSPDKSIVCSLNALGAKCTVKEPKWKPAGEGAKCADRWVLRTDNSSDGVFYCMPGPLAASQPLAFGDDVTRGGFSCQSREAGIRCINVKTQHGFSLSKLSYMTY